MRASTLAVQITRVVPEVTSADPCACPLIVFSHGAFSSSASYDRILKPLARAGFRIAAPRHTDAFDHPDRERYGSDDWLAARLEDVDAVLDHMADTDAVDGFLEDEPYLRVALYGDVQVHRWTPGGPENLNRRGELA